MSLIPAAYRGEQSDDLVGSLVYGCRVERLLGRGGMGAAYLARRESDGLAVVVKVLAPEVVRDAEILARFQREGEALSKLPPHPNLVGILGVEGGERPAIVMEYIEGQSLFSLIRGRGRLTATEAAGLCRQVALGLAAAHAQGLVHRDLNPANVVVTPEHVAKVIDFGIAKDLHRSTLTQAGQIIGTVTYMAPEQLVGKRADGRCDVFALGSTLYQLLVGRAPFVAPDAAEVAQRIFDGEFDLPSELQPGVPPELERVIIQLLEPELRYRYGSMAEVAEDLERVLNCQPCSCACLVSATGSRVPLVPGRRFTLGADPSCQVPLVHPSVSKVHAQLRREKAGWVLYDMRSERGTFVGQERVSLAPRPLADGEVIRLGELAIKFRDPRAPRG